MIVPIERTLPMQQKKILVIDGQGGKMGAALVAQLKAAALPAQIIAIGANSAATAAMLKAGADAAATGENPVVVNCKCADVICGPMGIITANALLGEITPAMAAAVSESPAQKLLIPVNRCSVTVVGVNELPLGSTSSWPPKRPRSCSMPKPLRSSPFCGLIIGNANGEAPGPAPPGAPRRPAPRGGRRPSSTPVEPGRRGPSFSSPLTPHERTRHGRTLGPLRQRPQPPPPHPPAGPAPGPGEYHMAVIVVIVNSRGEVLLTRRAKEKDLCPGWWENTGGSVLAGETSLEAILRELREETGIRARPEELDPAPPGKLPHRRPLRHLRPHLGGGGRGHPLPARGDRRRPLAPP